MDEVITGLLNEMKQLRPRREAASDAAQRALESRDLQALRIATDEERALIAEYLDLMTRVQVRLRVL